MRTFIVIALNFLFSCINGQQAPRSLAEDMTHVYRIKVLSGQGKPIQGTAFGILHENQGYWVTARHLFPKTKNGESVRLQIHLNDKWTNWQSLQVWLHEEDSVDVAVFPMPEASYSHLLPLTVNVADYGYCLGFDAELGEGRGLLLRGVSLAGVTSLPGETDTLDILVFDGQFVGGFSSGPVLFRDADDHTAQYLSVIGVIKGYFDDGYSAALPSKYIVQIIEANLARGE